MNDNTTQKQKDLILAPRRFMLNLCDADLKALYEKAGSASITPELLIENFISDLVSGKYSNGSDERMYADNWYERCWFSMSEYDSLLAYLIREGVYYDFIDCCIVAATNKEAIKDCLEDDKMSSGEKQENIALWKMEIEEAEEAMHNMYEDYCEYNETPDDYEKERDEVIKFRQSFLSKYHGIYSKDERTVND